MIVVKIELWPFGFEDKKQLLGMATITNDGSGTPTVGNYNVKLFQKGSDKKIWKAAHVKGFKRKQMGAYDLVALAFTWALGPDRVKRWGN